MDINVKILIKCVRERTGMTHRESTAAVKATLATLREAIADGGSVNLKGLLSVKRVPRKERTYVGRLTNTTTFRPAHIRPAAYLSGPLIKEATQEV